MCAFLPDGGGYAELVAVSAVHVLPIPKGLNVVKSAALPCAAAIIWLGFFSMNKLNCHDKILVNNFIVISIKAHYSFFIVEYLDIADTWRSRGCWIVGNSNCQKPKVYCICNRGFIPLGLPRS
mgnify:CR=1 FL=1